MYALLHMRFLMVAREDCEIAQLKLVDTVSRTAIRLPFESHYIAVKKFATLQFTLSNCPKSDCVVPKMFWWSLAEILSFSFTPLKLHVIKFLISHTQLDLRKFQYYPSPHTTLYKKRQDRHICHEHNYSCTCMLLNFRLCCQLHCTWLKALHV